MEKKAFTFKRWETLKNLNLEEVKFLDKTIVAAGGAIAALGAGFAIAGELDYTLHSAYGMGGAFWTVIGAVTIGFGLKVKRAEKSEKPIRVGVV